MKKVFFLLVFLFTANQISLADEPSIAKGEKNMEQLQKATFAGGCFWCMESPFEKLKGVKKVTSGYTGGHKANPTYEEVCTGTTGHYESVQVAYDPKEISYEKLLDAFWRNIDPTDP